MSPTVPDFCRRAPRPSFVCLVPHVSALTSDEQKYSLHIRDSDYSEETTPASSRDARSRATSPPIAGSSSPPDPRPIRVRREAASARNEGRWRHQGLRRRRWRRGADADAAAATRGAPLLLPLLPRRLLRLAPLHPGSGGGGHAGAEGAAAGGGVARDALRRVRRGGAVLDPIPDFELAPSCIVLSTICDIRTV